MTESLRRSIEPNGQLDAISLESGQSPERVPASPIEEFLTLCNEEELAPTAALAAFIQDALDTPTQDEWSLHLRQHMLQPDDRQFDDLILTDDTFAEIFRLLLASKRLVGRGEAMSQERHALLELLELRAGQVLQATEGADDETVEAWRNLLAKLFPDLVAK